MSSDQVDPKLKALMARHDLMTRQRSEQDSVFQELKDLVRPDTSDFFGGTSRARDARRKIFDSTASWSAEQLSSGLHSYNSSPVDRWFALTVAGIPYGDLRYDERLWLENTSEILYAHYSDPVSSLNPALHEAYLDIAVFGTAVIYQWYDVAHRRLMFRSFPLADCWVDEAPDGSVNRLHRRIKWTVEQIEKEFGFLPPKLAKIKEEKRAEEEHEVVHCVYQNDDYNPYNRQPGNRRFVSCYYCKGTEEMLSEGGYDWMPYHSPRWTKLAGEKYGRSPALSVLPDIRMVNAMSKTVISAAQKMVDPALQVPDDGFILPLRTTPGGLNFRRPGAEQILPMPTAQRVDVGVDMIEQRREMIRRGFYVDWLVRPTKKERQTAQEIMDDRNQMLSMMGPIVGRLQAELLGPMLRYSYFLLNRHGDLEAPPASLAPHRLDVGYLSPAARAQSSVRGQGINIFVDRIVQLQPVMPSIVDAINEDQLVAEMSDYMDVPRSVMASPQMVAERKKARADQQQTQQLIEGAPAAASAAKDFATAQEKGLQLF